MAKINKSWYAIFILYTIMGSIHLYAQVDTSYIKMPVFISKPELTYPSVAKMGRVVGKIWLKIFLSKNGIPLKTDIIKRDPEMAFLFDDNARKWGMQCKFTPAINKDGNPAEVAIVAPIRFTLEQFTAAKCYKQAEPEYPAEARELGMEGWVGLAVLIKNDGEVDHSNIIIVAREPASTSIFDDAAKEAAYLSKYFAATSENHPVASWYFIKVSFNLIPNGSNSKK